MNKMELIDMMFAVIECISSVTFLIPRESGFLLIFTWP